MLQAVLYATMLVALNVFTTESKDRGILPILADYPHYERRYTFILALNDGFITPLIYILGGLFSYLIFPQSNQVLAFLNSFKGSIAYYLIVIIVAGSMLLGIARFIEAIPYYFKRIVK